MWRNTQKKSNTLVGFYTVVPVYSKNHQLNQTEDAPQLLVFELPELVDVLVRAPGMLHRWDDSQKYLSDNPHLVCEETANCLVVICIDFEIDEVNV